MLLCKRVPTQLLPRYFTLDEPRMASFLTCAPLFTQAMSSLIDHMGGRQGLSQMAVIFKEMDMDGSGQLDYQEFEAGLKKFGMDVSQEEVSGMLLLLDNDGSGTLDLEEFQSIVKAELECAAVDELFDEEGDDAGNLKELKKQAAKAAHQGVRYHRSASVAMDDFKKQGAPEMMTAAAVAARQGIKEHMAIRSFMREWWGSIPGEPEHGFGHVMGDILHMKRKRKKKKPSAAPRNMTEEQFVVMSMAINKLLDPKVSEADARQAAVEDWVTDSNEAEDYMDYEHFFESMFELCDTWVDGLDAKDYIHLMRKCQAAHLDAVKEAHEEKHQDAKEAARMPAIAAASMAKKAAQEVVLLLLSVKLSIDKAQKKIVRQDKMHRVKTLMANRIDGVKTAAASAAAASYAAVAAALKALTIAQTAILSELGVAEGEMSASDVQALGDTLAACGSDEERAAVKGLLASCGSEEEKKALVAAMAACGSAAERKALVKAMASCGSAAERKALVAAMASCGSEEERKALVAAMASCGSEEERKALVKAMAACGSAEERKALVTAMAACSSEEDRKALVAAMASCGSAADRRKLVAAMASLGSDAERKAFVAAMAACGSEEERRALAMTLASATSQAERYRAVHATEPHTTTKTEPVKLSHTSVHKIMNNNQQRPTSPQQVLPTNALNPTNPCPASPETTKTRTKLQSDKDLSSAARRASLAAAVGKNLFDDLGWFWHRMHLGLGKKCVLCRMKKILGDKWDLDMELLRQIWPAQLEWFLSCRCGEHHWSTQQQVEAYETARAMKLAHADMAKVFAECFMNNARANKIEVGHWFEERWRRKHHIPILEVQWPIAEEQHTNGRRKNGRKISTTGAGTKRRQGSTGEFVGRHIIDPVRQALAPMPYSASATSAGEYGTDIADAAVRQASSGTGTLNPSLLSSPHTLTAASMGQLPQSPFATPRTSSRQSSVRSACNSPPPGFGSPYMYTDTQLGAMPSNVTPRTSYPLFDPRLVQSEWTPRSQTPRTARELLTSRSSVRSGSRSSLFSNGYEGLPTSARASTPGKSTRQVRAGSTFGSPPPIGILNPTPRSKQKLPQYGEISCADFLDGINGLGRKSKKHGKRRRKPRQKLDSGNAMDSYIQMYEHQVQVEVDKRLVPGMQQQRKQTQQRKSSRFGERFAGRSGLQQGLWQADARTSPPGADSQPVHPEKEEEEEEEEEEEGGELVIRDPDPISRPTTPSSVPSLSLLPEVLSPSKLSHHMSFEASSPQHAGETIPRPRSPGAQGRPRTPQLGLPRSLLTRPRTPILAPHKMQTPTKQSRPLSASLPSSLPVLSPAARQKHTFDRD
jgi:hypothetical protein